MMMLFSYTVLSMQPGNFELNNCYQQLEVQNVSLLNLNQFMDLNRLQPFLVYKMCVIAWSEEHALISVHVVIG